MVQLVLQLMSKTYEKKRALELHTNISNEKLTD